MSLPHTLARPALLAASIALLLGLSSDADAQRRRSAAPKGPPPVTTCTDLYSFANKDWLDANVVVAGQGTRSALGELQALIDTTNATINAGPAPYIKGLARVLRLVIRLLLRRFDGAA